jgi:hypothetical protein
MEGSLESRRSDGRPMERCGNAVKQFWRVATRYEKTTRAFLYMLCIGAAKLWIETVSLAYPGGLIRLKLILSHKRNLIMGADAAHCGTAATRADEEEGWMYYTTDGKKTVAKTAGDSHTMAYCMVPPEAAKAAMEPAAAAKAKA